MISGYVFENKHIGVKRCRHGVFAFNRNDAFIGRSLDQYGEWCDFEIQLLSRFIDSGSTVVDAGANIGTHTVPFSTMVGRKGRVVAFEAQPRLFQILCANLALNGIENVDARMEIVTANPNAVIQIADLPPSDTFFNFGAVPVCGNSSHRVKTQTIDSLLLENCSLIKADVEGMEADVLNGAVETIEKFKPVIYVESNGDESLAIAKALEKINYRAYWSIGPYFNPHNFYGNHINIWLGVMPSVNLIAVPTDSAYVFPDGQPFGGAQDSWRNHKSKAA